ncbi:MAG: HDOD domain-containing protein, partial [Gammaproteobacteria bacterium]|nr:HDOD domain-containing protein [Gammaproteobacteria bacterium]
ADNAFLCGLLHGIGKLYILTKAKDYPKMLGDEASLEKVLADWHPGIGKSIIESWGFPQEIADTMELADNVRVAGDEANLVDVVYTAIALLDAPDDTLARVPLSPAVARVISSSESFDSIKDAYDQHAQSIRQSVGG